MEELLARYPALLPCKAEIARALDLMVGTYRRGGKLLLCGNGGSAADCSHITGELLKGFQLCRAPTPEEAARFREAAPDIGEQLCTALQRGIPAISIPDQTAALTAYANDAAPEFMYAQLVYAYGRPEDLLLALSTSGNSKNVVYAVQTARALGMDTLALTGDGGGRLGELCSCVIAVPERETFKIQEYHLPVYHYLCSEMERILFGST